MGQTTNKELKLEAEKEMVEAYIRKGKIDFGENRVTTYTGEDGSTIIRIANDSNHLSRKEHNTPEHLRTIGG